MNNNQPLNNSDFPQKVVPEKPVAKTNPLNSGQDYHDIDDMGKDLGVEWEDQQELSMHDRLKSRDKQR